MREVFDLSVAVQMIAVGRAAGDAHGQKGRQGGHQVQAGVGGFGQNSQAAG